MTLDRQLVLLFVLPIPIASIAWTVTHEEVFREPREWCAARSRSAAAAVTVNGSAPDSHRGGV